MFLSQVQDIVGAGSRAVDITTELFETHAFDPKLLDDDADLESIIAPFLVDGMPLQPKSSYKIALTTKTQNRDDEIKSLRMQLISRDNRINQLQGQIRRISNNASAFQNRVYHGEQFNKSMPKSLFVLQQPPRFQENSQSTF